MHSIRGCGPPDDPIVLNANGAKASGRRARRHRVVNPVGSARKTLRDVEARGECLADVRTYDEAMADAGASIPHEAMTRLVEGENPIKVNRDVESRSREGRRRRLVIRESEAATVRAIFDRFVEVGSATMLVKELRRDGVTTRSGTPIRTTFLHHLLNNRIYIGEVTHKGESYPGQHEGIIPRPLWDKVHTILQESPRKRTSATRAQTPALLKGLLYGPDGAAFSPTQTRKGGRLYRYYVSQSVLQRGSGACPVGRVSAAEIEAAVVDQLRAVFRQPEIIVGAWRAAKAEDGAITEDEVREALTQFDQLWDELFPTEQARIVALVVEQVEIGLDGLEVKLRVDGLAGLADELRTAA